MPLSALDIFAGCGGLSLGLRRAGFDILFANEIDKFAAETYRANHQNTQLLEGDVREIGAEIWQRYKGIDLLAGGPPCQGFSVTGRRQYGEIPSQNTLIESFLDVVSWVRPKVVLMENVAGFRTAKLRPEVLAMESVLERLKDCGYTVVWRLLQATDFGVASLRSRLFIIASRVGWTSDPFPEIVRSHPQGCYDAISDLPPLLAGEGAEGKQAYHLPARNEYQLEMRQGSNGVFNHVAMRHTPALVERFSTIKPGGSSYLLPDSKITVYKSNNQRLVGELPSLCITANFQSNYIHPDVTP